MGPFQRVVHDVAAVMNQRNLLLAQPDEFYRESSTDERRLCRRSCSGLKKKSGNRSR